MKKIKALKIEQCFLNEFCGKRRIVDIYKDAFDAQKEELFNVLGRRGKVTFGYVKHEKILVATVYFDDGSEVCFFENLLKKTKTKDTKFVHDFCHRIIEEIKGL